MAGTSYTRQSTLTDGDTITASLFNTEYNQLVSAFAYASSGTTGHQHDGGAGEGGNIHTIGDQDFNNKIVVDYAMRYGNPSIKSKLEILKKQGCENIVLLPLYPQYAAATTATVCDEVYRNLMKMRWQPSLQIIPHYESEPFYIRALVSSIEKKINEINWKPDLIISSYHGIPKSYFNKGDPYHCYCQKTTRLIKEKFTKVEIQTTFQSRFGPQEWLTPYTDKTLESLPKKGIKNLLVICPGFASDCVETLEEINIQGKESFLKSGGVNFDLIPCLNDNSDHIELFEKLVNRYI